jgi:hypothetical protein
MRLLWFGVNLAALAPARRLISRFPAQYWLRATLRAVVVFILLGLTLVGLELVHAQDRANIFFDRAMTIRAGMTVDEVHAVLGAPQDVRSQKDNPSLHCAAGASRVAVYWYEHDRLPLRLSRSGPGLVVCSDERGRVIDVSRIHIN